MTPRWFKVDKWWLSIIPPPPLFFNQLKATITGHFSQLVLLCCRDLKITVLLFNRYRTILSQRINCVTAVMTNNNNLLSSTDFITIERCTVVNKLKCFKTFKITWFIKSARQVKHVCFHMWRLHVGGYDLHLVIKERPFVGRSKSYNLFWEKGG